MIDVERQCRPTQFELNTAKRLATSVNVRHKPEEVRHTGSNSILNLLSAVVGASTMYSQPNLILKVI